MLELGFLFVLHYKHYYVGPSEMMMDGGALTTNPTLIHTRRCRLCFFRKKGTKRIGLFIQGGRGGVCEPAQVQLFFLSTCWPVVIFLCRERLGIEFLCHI